MPDVRSLIRKLPKGDLHSHIDGTIPARDLFDIAKRHRRKIISRSGKELDSPSHLAEHVAGGGYEGMLEEIIDRFYPIVGIMQTEEVIREVGVAYVAELKRHNVTYAEGRFAPQYHLREGLSHSQAIGSMVRGLAEGTEEYGARVGLVVAIGRESSADKGIEIARAAAASGAAVALDLGGPEARNPPEKFQEAFKLAAKTGLNRTVHAGEGAGSIKKNLDNIRASIERLGAERIGHAIDIAKDKGLVRLAVERGVTLEMNPVSNLVLGKIGKIRDLGINSLMGSGIKVTVNSDDPALWPHGSIDEVLAAVCAAYGFGQSELNTLIANSFSCSFASASIKEDLLEEYSRAFKRELQGPA